VNWDNAYNKLITDIYKHGVWSDGHVRTKYADESPALYKSLIGYPLVLDNSTDDAFLLTTKHVAWKNSIKEMYWIYILQNNDVNVLENMKCPVWSAWKQEDGSIGKAYSFQLRKPTFGYSNQLEYVIETIKKDPNSRRIMIDLWCPEELHEMALTPCCYNLIFNVQKDKLYMQLNIRSSDTALGLPFNVFQFQVLHKLIAHECNLKPANLIIMISNVHYYDRHEEDLLKQIKNPLYKSAKLHIDYPDSIWDFKPEMVTVEDYEHGPKISYEIAI
jgi:thymidylate synthase